MVTNNGYATTPTTLPSVSQVQSYLRFKGWREFPPGPAGCLWANNAASIAVPNDEEEFLIKGAIDRSQISNTVINPRLEIPSDFSYLIVRVYARRMIS